MYPQDFTACISALTIMIVYILISGYMVTWERLGLIVYRGRFKRAEARECVWADQVWYK